MCGCSENQVLTSGLVYDGERFVPAGSVGQSLTAYIIKPCDTLNDVLLKLAKIGDTYKVMKFTTEALGGGAGGDPAVALTGTDFTVPAGQQGLYKITYYVNADLPGAGGAPFSELEVSFWRNSILVDATTSKRAMNENLANIETVIAFSIVESFSAGDTMEIRGLRRGAGVFTNGVYEIVKLRSYV
jgi:hypothetical protein